MSAITMFRRLFATKARTVRYSKPAHKARLDILTLERRDCPTTASLSPTTGILTVTGTEAAETITIQQGINYQQSATSISPWIIAVAGKTFTVSAVNKIVVRGLGGNDVIQNNTSKDAELYGDGGRDLIYGGWGNDQIRGGTNDDTLYGGDGNDTLYGEQGGDSLYGGNGADFLIGGNDSDRLEGQGGDDIVVGSDWNFATGATVFEIATTTAYTTNDTLFGGNGNDTLYGGVGRDWLWGEANDDKLFGQGDADALDGGTGNDYLEGGDEPDGTLGDNIVGRDGHDTLLGQGGNDTLWGAYWQDQYEAGPGNDSLDGGSGDDVLHGGNGYDVLYGGTGIDNLYGEDGNDGLFGGNQDGRDFLDGGAGADRMLVPQFYYNGNTWVDEDAIVVNVLNPQSVANAVGDAKLNFAPGDKNWTDAEIQQVDVGLAWLHQVTNNTALLTRGLAVRGEQMFQRYTNLPGSGPGAITLADNSDSKGLIRVADGAFTSSIPAGQTIVHEIGHNWDDENGDWEGFKDLSGWSLWVYDTTISPVPDGYTQGADLSGVAQPWMYLSTAEFGRPDGYGRTDPFEDFASSLEYYYAGTNPAANWQSKWNFIDNFIRSISS